ncbi:MAG: hypothetical protein K5650_03090 [Bacteroidales bacterium]|nr:hypothetical protein [Bacteroidales bacterium]
MKKNITTIFIIAAATILATGCIRSQKETNRLVDEALARKGAQLVAVYTEGDNGSANWQFDSVQFAEYYNALNIKRGSTLRLDSIKLWDEKPLSRTKPANFEIYTSDADSTWGFTGYNLYKRLDPAHTTTRYYLSDEISLINSTEEYCEGETDALVAKAEDMPDTHYATTDKGLLEAFAEIDSRNNKGCTYSDYDVLHKAIELSHK